MKKITCRHCGEQIKTKDTLAVVGNAFRTYHRQCYQDNRFKDVYLLLTWYRTNSIFPWVGLLVALTMIWGLYFMYNFPLDRAMLFSAIMIVFVPLGPLLSYYLYERHLK